MTWVQALQAAIAAIWRGFGMSFFSNLGHWFVQSGIENAAKQAAVKALTDSANEFVAQIGTHAPDLQNHLESQLASILAQSVAGALTRKG